MVASEAYPFSKTGGLADIAGSLPLALDSIEMGSSKINASLVVPLYKQNYNLITDDDVFAEGKIEIDKKTIKVEYAKIKHPDNDNITVYFVKQDKLFKRDGLYSENGIDYEDNAERFIVFSKAVVQLIMYLYDEEDFKVSTNKIKLVNDIARARLEEIVDIAMKKLEHNNLNSALQYIVLTGGTALIPGIDIFINSITNVETRVGYNEKLAIQDKSLSVELKSPIYAVSLGILKFIQNRYNNKTYKEEEQSTLFKFLSNIFGI